MKKSNEPCRHLWRKLAEKHIVGHYENPHNPNPYEWVSEKLLVVVCCDRCGEIREI